MKNKLAVEFDRFQESINAKEFSRRLRYMTLEFMKTEAAKDSFITNGLMCDLYTLHALLDAIEDLK